MALDPKIKDRYTRLLAVRMDEQSRQLYDSVRSLQFDMARRGMVQSGGHVAQLFDAHRKELETRAAIAWQALHRAHVTCGSPTYEGIGADLKSELSASIHSEAARLKASFTDHAKRISVFKDHPQFDLTTDCRALVHKHELEIEIYEDSIMSGKNNESGPVQQYHFYGSVGAVQTGANARANIVQSLGESELTSLKEALRLARDAIDTTTPMDDLKRQELVGIADDCIEELDSASPNNTRLLPLFTVLATSVQAIASARPAYLALRSALLPLGITLP